jgi:predicted RNase H-like HicB family nuclease
MREPGFLLRRHVGIRIIRLSAEPKLQPAQSFPKSGQGQGAHCVTSWSFQGIIFDRISCRYNNGMQSFTVEIIPDEEQGGFTARVPDIPAYGEGDTADEAIADLKEALYAYVESFGLEDALARLNAPAA